MPRLERRFLRQIEGALGSPDEGLIIWDLMKDHTELIDQLAALAIRASRGTAADELLTGDDPGDQADEEARWEHDHQIFKAKQETNRLRRSSWFQLSKTPETLVGLRDNDRLSFEGLFTRDVQ